MFTLFFLKICTIFKLKNILNFKCTKINKFLIVIIFLIFKLVKMCINLNLYTLRSDIYVAIQECQILEEGVVSVLRLSRWVHQFTGSIICIKYFSNNCLAVYYCSYVCQTDAWYSSFNPDHSHSKWCNKMKFFMSCEYLLQDMPFNFVYSWFILVCMHFRNYIIFFYT